MGTQNDHARCNAKEWYNARATKPNRNGKGNPTLRTLAKIAGAFDLKLSEFFEKLENNEILAVKKKAKARNYRSYY